MITHSFVMAVLESYTMAARQVRWLAKILPPNWELIFVDDGSVPEIPIPSGCPPMFTLLRTREVRQPGEWTQHEAINWGVETARGEYIVKSDVDHIFTPAAIAAADSFAGDMMLFERKAGLLAPGLPVTPLDHPVHAPVDELYVMPLDHPVHTPVDDIYVMRRSLFIDRGGYPVTRRYGGAGKAFWDFSRRPEAQPPAGALIYVAPDTHEQYHSLKRVAA